MKKIITIVLLGLSLQSFAQCWQSISAGYNHSLAVKDDGTLWAWGDNGTGKLGDNTTVDKNIPTQIGTDTNWLKVCANFGSSYAIKADGTLWAWGVNSQGQLGLGTSSFSIHVPTQVGNDTDWQNISSTDQHCIALKTNGTLWSWGYNNRGQLGDNTTVNKNTPIQIGVDINWQTISTGNSNSFAIKSDGTLWAWGWNANGFLGDGTNIQRNVPVQVGTATNWQKVDGGYFHSTGIKTDGTLWAWGTNTSGQFGIVTSPLISYIPVQVGTDNDWLNVSASWNSTFAIKTNHTLWSTGRNNEGQLGNGTSSTTETLVFTQVGTFSDSDEIATTSFHVLEKNEDGFIRATGKNDSGQLGDGTNVDKNTLTYISCYPTVLSVENFTVNEVRIYSNPVNDVVNLSFDQAMTSVAVYNLLGQEVITKWVKANETSIDVSALPSGTYLIKVAVNDTVKTVKVVKQ